MENKKCNSKEIHNKTLFSGAYSGICPGGAYFFSLTRGGSAPVGAWKPPKIIKFLCSRGGLSPHAPPEYASDFFSLT